MRAPELAYVCRASRPVLIAGATVLLGASAAQAAIVPAEIIVQEGTMPDGAPADADAVSAPFALADGTVAFAGGLADGDDFVWSGDQVVWLNSNELAAVLSGAEGSMGGAEGGLFIYSPQLNGLDSVWTHNGLLAVEDDQAPAFPAGSVLTFNSRPSMIADGTVYWIAGVNNSGGTATEQRVLYRSASAMPGDAEVVVAAGDMVGGLTVESPDGVDFDYHVSSGGSHVIQLLRMETGSANDDGHVAIDGVLVHQENTLNGSGDNWDNFDLFAINEAGSYIFSGDTDGATTSDEFIAINGTIALREGDVVDGITLQSTATTRFVAIDDQDRVAFGMAYGGGTAETIFYACDSSDVLNSAVAVATTTFDEFDFDDDGMADATFDDLNISSVGASNVLASDAIYLDVDLDQGGTLTEAMIRIPVTCCGNMIVDGGEQCDDGNDDDSDLCPSTCQDAVCGDGFVLDGTEECDDGNNEDGDGCAADCTVEMMMGTTGTTGTTTDGGESTDTGTTDGGTTDTGATTDGGTTTEGGSGSTTEVGGASEEGSDSDGGTTAADATGGLDDTGTGSGGTGGVASTGPATTMTTAAPMDGTSDGDTETEGGDGAAVGDDGCSCRSRGSGSLPVWALALLVLAPRRRRDAVVARRGRSPE